MAFSTGSQTRFTYINETVYGVSDFAVDGDSDEVSFISDGLNLTKGIFEDPSIISDRQTRFSRHGNKEVAGDVAFAFANTNYDPFLESVMFSSFNANVLKVGSTLKSFTVEVGHEDIGQYQLFTGLVANSFDLEVNLDGVVQSTFGMLGRDMSISGVEQDTSPTPPGDFQPYVHFDGVFKEGGASTGILTGITLNIDNGVDMNYALGDSAVKELTSSMIAISGQVTAYFENADLLNAFLNETETTIEFTLDDSFGNTHTFFLPKVKYNGADIPVTDGSTLPITLPFVALFDATEASTLTITRS